MNSASSRSFFFVLACWTLAILLVPVLRFGPTLAYGGRDRYFLEMLLFIWAYASVFGIPVFLGAWGAFTLLQRAGLAPLLRYGLWNLCVHLLILTVLHFGFTGPGQGMSLPAFYPVFGAAALASVLMLPLYHKFFVPKKH